MPMPLAFDQARLPSVGDTIGDKYRVECVLGSGGMGVVFGATHLITHKRVAIKWLAVESAGSAGSDTTKRFVREARLAGEFQHPNVVQVYDFGKSEGSFFMVMEWLQGESLAARLERVKRLSFRETLECLIPCMHAMERAHDAGIIHRDLKPANIFLCEATPDRPATFKVLDFGISKRIASAANMDAGSLVTRTGMLIGTPQYLSPEQLRSRPVDRRTDIYCFGVMLYETLAGVLPFTADNFGDLVVQISTSTPRPLRELVPHLPIGVEQVIAKAMARNPDDRYDSLHDLVAALSAIDPSPLTAATLPQLDVPTSLTPVATEPRSRPPSRGRSLPVYALGLLGAVAAGLFLVERERSSAPEAMPPAPIEPNATAPDTPRPPPQLQGSPAAQRARAADVADLTDNPLAPVDTVELDPKLSRGLSVGAGPASRTPATRDKPDAGRPAAAALDLAPKHKPETARPVAERAPEATLRPSDHARAHPEADGQSDKPRAATVSPPSPATPPAEQAEPLDLHDGRLKHNPLEMTIQ